MLTADELMALDDWRFAQRMPSRAAAVRELLRRGLATEGYALADGRMRSKDFGVTGSTSKLSDTPAPRGNGARRPNGGDGSDTAP
jgi:hypothetical protein